MLLSVSGLSLFIEVLLLPLRARGQISPDKVLILLNDILTPLPTLNPYELIGSLRYFVKYGVSLVGIRYIRHFEHVDIHS